MMYLILGVLIGLILAVIASIVTALLVINFRDEVQEFVEDLPKDLGGKAEIFEPTSPEVEAMEAVIEENEKKGRDTKIEEL